MFVVVVSLSLWCCLLMCCREGLSVDHAGETETQNPTDAPPCDRTFTVSNTTDESLPAVVPLSAVSSAINNHAAFNYNLISDLFILR